MSVPDSPFGFSRSAAPDWSMTLTWAQPEPARSRSTATPLTRRHRDRRGPWSPRSWSARMLTSPAYRTMRAALQRVARPPRVLWTAPPDVVRLPRADVGRGPAAPALQPRGPASGRIGRNRGGSCGPALRPREQAGRAEQAGNNEQRGREKLARGATVALLDRPSCARSVLSSPYWARGPGARRGLDCVSERVRIPRCRHTLMMPVRSRE